MIRGGFRLGSAFLVFLLSFAPRASAQQQEVDPSERARYHIGALRFTPTISFTNLGFDTNVFNEDVNPKRDNTGAAGPDIQLWMHLGRSRLSGRVSGQYLYFQQFDNQRGFNTTDDLRWEVPLARITPFVEGQYVNTKSRPGYEIDSRARQTAQAARVGAEIELSGKTTLVMSGARARAAFDDDETFQGVDLATVLNKNTMFEELQLRYQLTTITTFVAKAEAFQERFPLYPSRNANSFRVLPGFEMKPSALISGKVFVGYRQFEPLDPSVPSYQGPVAAVDAKYAISATQFDVKVARDLTYSYQALQPYYTLTDMSVGVTERLTYTWDVVARVGRQLLDFKQLHSALPLSNAQSDRIEQYTAGIGYRLGRTVRLGVDGIYYRRHSTNVQFHDYEGTRVGASFTYGLSQ